MTGAASRPQWSYRSDPAVPEFDDSGPITVMDGNCALCSVGARLISRFDRRQQVRICRSQGPLGSALMRHYGFDPDDPESWILIENGRALNSLDAMIRAGAIVGGPGWLLQPLRLLPRPVRDWIYRRIALNRYRLFGRTDMCSLPDPALKARLIE